VGFPEGLPKTRPSKIQKNVLRDKYRAGHPNKVRGGTQAHKMKILLIDDEWIRNSLRLYLEGEGCH